jgi:hypothetical protein
MPLIWPKSSKKKTMLLWTKDKERLLEIFHQQILRWKSGLTAAV